MAGDDNNIPSDDDEKLIVEVEGEEKDAEIEAPDDASPSDKIKLLKEQLDRERRARQEAEMLARQAAEQANAAYSRADDSDMHVVNTAIATVQSENEVLTDKYAEAIEAGDYQAAAKIQRTISQNEAKLLQLENGRAAMQSRPRQPVVQVPQQSDPVERFAAQLSPRSADWVRRNPQCVTDPRLNQKMIAAHNLAVADGYEPDSDDYFGYIEDTLRINSGRQPRRADADEGSPLSSASKPSRSAPPPAAPASREPTSRNQMRLTAAEAETARSLGMSPEDYAKNKLLLRREGRMH